MFIGLTDNSYDEIHENNVADNQNEEPEEPCQDFEVLSALNDWRGVVVTDRFTEYYHKNCNCFDSFVVISNVVDNDLGHDGEESNH